MLDSFFSSHSPASRNSGKRSLGTNPPIGILQILNPEFTIAFVVIADIDALHE